MSAHDAPLVIGPAEKVYRFPVRQICATTPCAHSVWTHDDPIFEKLRREQASANKPEVGLVLLYNKDARELVPFEGYVAARHSDRPNMIHSVFLQQCQANYRAVAPSSWISTAVKHNSGLLDKILCFCAADPAVPRSAARARVRKGTAYQGGYWLSCHRAPKLTKNGNFDYTDTCGMNGTSSSFLFIALHRSERRPPVKLHFYKVMEKLEYPQLPKYCIYVDLPRACHFAYPS